MVISVWDEAPQTLAKREGFVWFPTGPRGAGKTIFAVWKALDPKDGYYHDWTTNPNTWISGCWSNIYIAGFRKIDFNTFFDIDLAINDPSNWPYWNSFIVWDEPHRELDKRKSMTGENIDKSEIVDQLRKTGIDCIMPDKPDRVEKRVEQNYDVVVDCYVSDIGFTYYEYLVGARNPPAMEVLTYEEASTFWDKYRTHQMIESGYRKKAKNIGWKPYRREGREELYRQTVSKAVDLTKEDRGQRVGSSEIAKTATDPPAEDNHLSDSTKSTLRQDGITPQKIPDGVSSRRTGHALQTNYAKSLAMGEFKDQRYKIINNLESGPDIVILLNDKPYKVISYKSMYYEPLDTPLTYVDADGRERRTGKRSLWVGVDDVGPETDYCRTNSLQSFDLVVHNIRTGGYTVLRQDITTFRGVSVSLKDNPRLQ